MARMGPRRRDQTGAVAQHGRRQAIDPAFQRDKRALQHGRSSPFNDPASAPDVIQLPACESRLSPTHRLFHRHDHTFKDRLQPHADVQFSGGLAEIREKADDSEASGHLRRGAARKGFSRRIKPMRADQF